MAFGNINASPDGEFEPSVTRNPTTEKLAHLAEEIAENTDNLPLQYVAVLERKAEMAESSIAREYFAKRALEEELIA